jgi:hypothetical protein
MAGLTVAAIRADPRNAVEGEFPLTADHHLLQAACSAARLYADKEFDLMLAARKGSYTPVEWKQGYATDQPCPDFHEFSEARW